MNIHWKDWCWSWNSNTLATWCEELTHLKRLWCQERLKAGGEGDDRGWDVWMASRTQWTWVWVNSGSWSWTGRPGVLRSMGPRRVEHDWTELNWSWSSSRKWKERKLWCIGSLFYRNSQTKHLYLTWTERGKLNLLFLECFIYFVLYLLFFPFPESLFLLPIVMCALEW